MDEFNKLCESNVNELYNNPNILYELHNKYKWIADIIYNYNKLGFLTYVSQPGDEYENIMYKSEYCREKNQSAENILQTAIRKQRAYVRGYMNSDMANFIFNKLKYDQYIFVRTSNNNRPINFEIKFGSVNFYDNENPVLKEEIECDNIEDNKINPDANWSFNLKLPLRRSFSSIFKKEIENIIEIELVECRWSENDYIWTKLLEIMQEYNQNDLKR